MPSADRARLLALEGAIRLYSGRFAEGHSSSDAAVQMARIVGEPEALGMVLSDRAALLSIAGHAAEAVACAQEAQALLSKSPRRWAALWAAARLALAMRPIGGNPEERLRQCAELGCEAQLKGHRAAALGEVVARFSARSQIEGGLAVFSDAAREVTCDFADFGTWSELGALWEQLAAFEHGDDRAGPILLQVARRFREPSWADLFWVTAFWAIAAIDAGRARQVLDEFWSRIPVAGAPAWQGTRMALPALIRGLVSIGEAERAATLYPLCTDTIALGNVGEWWLMEEAAGRAAAAGRDWEAADRHFATALHQAHEMPNVFAQPDVRLAWAQMLVARGQNGDLTRARTLLTEAASKYERAGRTRGARVCRAMLASLPES